MPPERARARATVANWRDQDPAGTAEELIAAIGHRFHRDYAVVLRAVLLAVDRHRARQVTGLTARENRLPRPVDGPGLRYRAGRAGSDVTSATVSQEAS